MSDADRLEVENPWDDDRLGFKSLGETFTNLVQSVTLSEQSSKVISIEAGFGHGKSFFRERWARHLRNEGEVVIEIDAQQSDHSGDPVVTFLGALMEKLPAQEQSKWLKAWATGKKLAWGGVKIGASVVARKAGEEGVEAVEDWLSSDGETSTFDEVITEFGKQASKALSAQVTAQLSAERVRTVEMPAQMEALRKALTEGKDSDRVVILIDELDRCHPDYVIALLEAMKLVFNQPGFVFVLMVNPDQLHALAEHRFGKAESGERYLDKFVDLRLRLEPSAKAKAVAATELVMGLPDYEQFGDDREFSKERAGKLAADIVIASELTMRQIKRTLERIELVLRCYHGRPLDLPLLVHFAFEALIEVRLPETARLGRATCRPELAVECKSDFDNRDSIQEERNLEYKWREKVYEKFPELIKLPIERYRSPEGGFHDWARVILHLSPHYVPEHKAMLDYVQGLQADG